MEKQRKKGKILVFFFIGMLLITLLSRSADSFTVPVVTVGKAKSQTLKLEISGMGTIMSASSHYCRLPEGILVEKSYKLPGMTVKKGQPVLAFSLEDLNKMRRKKEKEVKKLEIQLNQQQLSNADTEDTKSSLVFAVQNAKEDLLDAKKDQKEAEKAYAVAKTKNVEVIKKEKQQEYDTVKNEYRTLLLSNRTVLNEAERVKEDASAALAATDETQLELIRSLDEYCSISDIEFQKRQTLRTKIFYYSFLGDDAAAVAYEKEVINASKAITNATEAVSDAQKAYNMASVNGASDLTSYLSAINSAKRTLNNAVSELSTIRDKESKSDQQVRNYEIAKKAGNTSDMQKAVDTLNEILYGENGLKKQQKEKEALQKAYNRACEDYNLAVSKCENEENKVERNLKEVEKILDSLTDGTYDFDAALKEQEAGLTTAKKAVTLAERALKDAKAQLANLGKSGKVKKKAAKLQEEAARIDLESAKEELALFDTLRKNGGKFLAPESGKLTVLTAQEGKTTTAEDVVSFGFGGYVAKFRLEKEEGEYVAIGDEIDLKQKGKSSTEKAVITSYQLITDEQNKEWVELLAKLDGKEYTAGTSVDMFFTKVFDQYNTCVPLQAIREDEKGTYILVLNSYDSILGLQQKAKRVAADIVDKDLTYAAIKGDSLTGDESVILSSSKPVASDSRVRIADDAN